MYLFLKRSSSEPTRIFQGKSSVKTGFGSLRRPGLHCFFLKSGYCGNAEPRKDQHTTCIQQKQLLQILPKLFWKKKSPKGSKNEVEENGIKKQQQSQQSPNCFFCSAQIPRLISRFGKRVCFEANTALKTSDAGNRQVRKFCFFGKPMT